MRIERQATFEKGLKAEGKATAKAQPYLEDLLRLPAKGGESETLAEVVREAGPFIKKRLADDKKRSTRADALLESSPACA